MPNIKGATYNPKTRKFEKPEGYTETKKLRAAEARAAGKKPKGVTARANVIKHRLSSQYSNQFIVYALYPAGQRAYLTHMDQPTHDELARLYGGGSYLAQEVDRDTGEYLGEPARFDVDKFAHPVRLPGFQTAPAGQPNALPLGFGGQFPNSFGGQVNPWPQPPQTAPGKNEELEEELDELEQEVAQLKVQLAEARRETDRIRSEAAEKQAAMERKAIEDKYMQGLKDLADRLDNKKDPLEQMLQFKRVEAELGPPKVGGGGMADQMGGLLAIFDLMDKVRERTKPPEESGSAASGFGEVIRAIGPLLQQAKEGRQTQTMEEVHVPPAPVVEPEPLSEKAVSAFDSMLSQADFYQAQGAMPLAFAENVLAASADGFDEARAVIKAEKPEGFLDLAKQHRPALVDSPEKTAWLLEAVSHIQRTMIERG